MEIDKDMLARSYADKPYDELLNLHAAGTLTEMAYEVLEGELAGRGVAVPKRPDGPVAPQGRPQSLRSHWEGRASLASAFWLIGVLGGIVFTYLFELLFKLLGSTIIVAVGVLTLIPYSIIALVSIWQCAWNTSWKGWGYIARTLVILNVTYIVLVVLGGIVYMQ